MALYDGRLLRVGDRIEAGSVVRITPDALYVRTAKGHVERLPMYPGIKLERSTRK